MSNDSNELVAKFIDLVNKTYDMLNANEKPHIKQAYLEIESVKNQYYNLLTKDGGTAHGCYLNYEFEYGLYCLEDKYLAIKDIAERD